MLSEKCYTERNKNSLFDVFLQKMLNAILIGNLVLYNFSTEKTSSFLAKLKKLER